MPPPLRSSSPARAAPGLGFLVHLINPEWRGCTVLTPSAMLLGRVARAGFGIAAWPVLGGMSSVGARRMTASSNAEAEGGSGSGPDGRLIGFGNVSSLSPRAFCSFGRTIGCPRPFWCRPSRENHSPRRRSLEKKVRKKGRCWEMDPYTSHWLGFPRNPRFSPRDRNCGSIKHNQFFVVIRRGRFVFCRVSVTGVGIAPAEIGKI